MGDGFNVDPNNCTYGAVRNFLLTDTTPTFKVDRLGTLPTNGTVCTTDHSGLNNVFIRNPLGGTVTTSSHRTLVLGLVLGLSFPLVITTAVVIGFWNLKRTGKRKEAIARIQRLKNGASTRTEAFTR